MKIKIKILDDRAVLPTKATDGSAMYDLAVTDGNVIMDGKKTCVWNTGLAVAIPKGYVMEIVPRSSTFKKYGLQLANQIGIIDSDYRGEIMLHTTYLERCPHLAPGTRIAQFKVVKQGLNCDWDVVHSLPDSSRGAGGFGSTGE